MLFGRTDPSSSNLFAVAIAENKPLLRMSMRPSTLCIRDTGDHRRRAFPDRDQAACGKMAGPRCGSGDVFPGAARGAEHHPLFSPRTPFYQHPARRCVRSVENPFSKTRRGNRDRRDRAAVINRGIRRRRPCGHARKRPGAGCIAPFSFPGGSVGFLDAHPNKGRPVQCRPVRRLPFVATVSGAESFIDTRYAIRPPAFLYEYCSMLDDPRLFEAVCVKYGITKAVMPTALTTSYFNLTAFL